MTPKQYRDALKRLNLSQARAAQVLHVSERTGRVYAADGPPGPVALAMELLMVVLALAPARLALICERRIAEWKRKERAR